MAYTNADIVPAARRGDNAQSATGNFWTASRNGSDPFGRDGQLPVRLSSIFRYTPTIDRVIYSYSTPIAWRDRGVWIVPAVTYSMTTSSKHAVHLYRLPNRRSVPWDASQEEYDRVVTGRMVYDPYTGPYGRYSAA